MATLAGDASANSISGTPAADSLSGAGGADTLTGLEGNDTLNGGSGIDSLIGGIGNDLYVVDSASDILVENLGEGTDTVKASVSWTLADNFERLILNGSANVSGTGNGVGNIITGNSGANALSGNGGSDKLIGGDGDDTLDGGTGKDTMQGGAGDDLYVVNAAGDVVDESGGDGTDTVDSSVAWTLGADVENLMLTGSANIKGTGNSLDNTITGNAGNNVLDGGLGRDLLDGGAGNDQLSYDGTDSIAGGAGSDTLKVDGSGLVLDLNTAAGTTLTDIETVDLTGAGNNVLALSAAKAAALSSSTDALRVTGNAGDRVIFEDSGWSAGTPGVSPSTTDYTNGSVTLEIDNAVKVVTSVTKSLTFDSSYTNTVGFRLKGANAYDEVGASLSAGDINGDGYDDLVVSAKTFSAGTGNNTASATYSIGATYVVFGTDALIGRDSDLANIGSTINGFRIDGVDKGGYSASVCATGDINGDGFADIVIGASGAGGYEDQFGGVYVVFGKASGFGSVMSLSSLDGTNGFKLLGNQSFGQAGHAVSVGDINGDGYDDLIVGASNEKWPNAQGGYTGEGQAYVIYGKASGWAANDTLLNAGVRMLGTTAQFNPTVASNKSINWETGASVAAIDINGDGLDDVAVGAPLGNLYGGTDNTGIVYLVSAGGVHQDLLLPNTPKIVGDTAGAGIGYSLANAGDVNGDGYDDFAIGANGGAGAAYVVFGKSGGIGSRLNLSALDGSNGFKLAGISGGAGSSVAAAGDINGDGYGDLIVGAALKGGSTHPGEAYVLFGKAGGFDAVINLSDIDGANGFVFQSQSTFSGRFGEAASAAGDLNGDGYDDLVVGAPFASPTSSAANIAKGMAYVLYGRDFTGAVDFAGTSGANSMQGSAAAENFVGGEGNDNLISGGGADAFHGGAGDDRIRTSLSFRFVDGGSGTDTLALVGKNLSLDLTAIPDARINGIEKIDLTGTGNNHLTLAKSDLLDLSDTGNLLTVDGNAGDAVTVAGGSWTDGGIANGYHSYTLDAATLLINTAITNVSITL